MVESSLTKKLILQTLLYRMYDKGLYLLMIRWIKITFIFVNDKGFYLLIIRRIKITFCCITSFNLRLTFVES